MTGGERDDQAGQSGSRCGGTQTEADIQADIQTVLAGGDLNLSVSDAPKMEHQTADGTRRRIDIAICGRDVGRAKDLTLTIVVCEARAVGLSRPVR